MKNIFTNAVAGINKYNMPVLLVLIISGLAGNYFKFSIFLNIDFLFGSIFAMLAVQFFGPGRGLFAAAVIAGSTYFIWNHPYSIIILTAEVAITGVLFSRMKMGLVLADTLYWLIIGMPLGFFFFNIIMQTPFSNTYIVIIKQAVNGIANALVARLIFTAFILRTRTSLTSYREILYNLLAFFVLCPSLIILAIGSKADFNETDLSIRSSLIQTSKRVNQRLETWVDNRKSSIMNLAEMSAIRPAWQMQSCLEQTKKSDHNFLYIGLQNREATTTAIFPLFDELGQSNIGKNFADRRYIPVLKQTLKPMLSEVVTGRIGTPKPLVAMLAPVVNHGEYSGYVFGILDLYQIQDYLDRSVDQHTSLYTLIDKNGNVIMTNRKDQNIMFPFMRNKGAVIQLDSQISQWMPELLPNTPTTELWLKSSYLSETAIGSMAEWKLVLEQPMAPFQKILYDSYSDKLSLLFIILLAALALAEFLSRRFVVKLDELRLVTRDLPLKLAADGKDIDWPQSGIKEAENLISNFREMADSLRAQFKEVRLINESLEHRVEQRTEELRKNEQRLAGIIRGANVGIWEWNVQTGETLINDRWAEIIGYNPDEISPVSIEIWVKFAYPEDIDIRNDLLNKHFHGELEYFEFEMRMKHKDGNRVWVLDRGKVATWTSDGKPLLMLGTMQDITARKLAEEKIKEISIRDPLTNIYNRRYIFERLEIIIVEFFRENKFFTISIIDLDNFKNVNDKYGHQAGDFILKEFTRIVSDNLRPYDLLGRYGGEEFIIVTMNSDKEKTKANMERIQDIIINKTFVYQAAEIKFTFSCGISENMEHDLENVSFEKIIGKADERLYEAKNTGRNRIII